ncbi:MAG: SET domain-containing protein [Nitrososphaerota archaeon]|nr:SET domain-containing protein [Nitrososphaerota archaeon]MDG6918177.1 SET domain-containing protein [Nitrososphaerota archaeon]
MGDAGPKGKGVFADRAIRASDVVVRFQGKPKWIWEIPRDVWPYTIQVDYDSYVVPKRRGLGWYLNHSCNPNCVISGMSVVTTRGVRKGEELTFDYSTNVDWPGFRMRCSCGAPQCRKVIKAYRFLSERLKRKYGTHVAPYLLRQQEP